MELPQLQRDVGSGNEGSLDINKVIYMKVFFKPKSALHKFGFRGRLGGTFFFLICNNSIEI